MHRRIALVIAATTTAGVQSFKTHAGNTIACRAEQCTNPITQRFGTIRPDATEAIADALRLSEEFGASSNEARVAWDIVEEMDSNDSSSVFNSAGTIDTPQDYRNQIKALSRLLRDTKSKLDQIKQLIINIKSLELADPTLSRISNDEVDGPVGALKIALANAKAASVVHGPSSEEAKEAWDKLEVCFGEDITDSLSSAECELNGSTPSYRYSAVALRAHHYYDAIVDAALMQESLDALDSLQGLGRLVGIEKRRLDERKIVGP